MNPVAASEVLVLSEGAVIQLLLSNLEGLPERHHWNRNLKKKICT
jgi:broad specificity phosphatase PhoE